MARYDYESKIVDIPDYPEPGVIFKDVMPLFADQEAFSTAVDEICDHFKGAGITKVVGSEARGFLFGTPVAYKLGVGFVPARKPGKLPRAVYSQSYSLEYGTNTVEMLQDALDPGDRVLVIDDLGKENANAWALTTLFQIINSRYEDGKPTIYTSQYDLQSLQRRMSRQRESESAEAIVSRICETSVIVQLGGKDRRRSPKAK